MSEPLWQPSAEAIAQSRLTEFAQRVGYGERSYNELHQWSVDQPDKFWQAAWDYFEIKASAPPSTTVEHLDRFPGAHLVSR